MNYQNEIKNLKEQFRLKKDENDAEKDKQVLQTFLKHTHKIIIKSEHL